MATVTVTPNPFVLVDYDAGALGALIEKIAGRIGLPDVDIAIEVDEALPRPLIASYVDVVDAGNGARTISIWCSGGNFEDPQYPRQFDDVGGEVKLAQDLRRGGDRLTPGFADAPSDSELTERQREAWDTWAAGRISRLGFPVRVPLVRYHFRLSNGFGDAVDAVYDRLWGADEITWAELEAACAETAGADERPTPKARPGAKGESLRLG